SYSEKYFSHVERPLFFPEGHEPAICDSSPYPFKRTEPEYPHPEMTQNHLYNENGQYNGDEPYGINPVEQIQTIEEPRHQDALRDVVGQRHLSHGLQQILHCIQLHHTKDEKPEL